VQLDEPLGYERALMTLTKNTGSYLNRYRIRVNQLNVGWTETPNERRVKIQEAAGTRPFGCLLVPRDIAFGALYFANDESECITGSLLICNITLSEFPSIADYHDCAAFLKAARSDVLESKIDLHSNAGTQCRSG
jgi:Enoyl-(Acyl carrier protein) reductase